MTYIGSSPRISLAPEGLCLQQHEHILGTMGTATRAVLKGEQHGVAGIACKMLPTGMGQYPRMRAIHSQVAGALHRL